MPPVHTDLQARTVSEIRAAIAGRSTSALEAMQDCLELPPGALSITWDSLKKVGNLSSASVLVVLEELQRSQQPEPGTYGVMLAMGPGFCSELLLLRW